MLQYITKNQSNALRKKDNSALSNSNIDEKFDSHAKAYSVLKPSHPKNQLLKDALTRSEHEAEEIGTWRLLIAWSGMADDLFECFDGVQYEIDGNKFCDNYLNEILYYGWIKKYHSQLWPIHQYKLWIILKLVNSITSG